MLPTPFLYQKDLINSATQEFTLSRRAVVLAACPGSGKTVMALHIAKPYIDEDKIVLVLTHGTNVLLDQWNAVVKEYGLDWVERGLLVLSLPQSQRKLKQFLTANKIGLLIVDEAHEFYHAKTVQQLRELANADHELLLTGTPSKFILENQNGVADRAVLIASGVEVYQHGRLQDTYFGMVKSAYNFKMNYERPHDEEDESEEQTDDYNGDGDLKRSIYLDPVQTKASMENVVEAMCLRLTQVMRQSPNVTNALTYLPSLKSWPGIFRALSKTMIAAHSIEQAKALRDILEEKFAGTECKIALSVSRGMSDDPDDIDEKGERIKQFQTDPDTKILIVVRRGILGFDMPELCNVVDFTCSRNINRIYQLYARVLRTHPKHNKFFFRVASNENPAVDSFFLQAALCLNNRDFISRFNGKNLSKMEVLVPRNRKFKEREHRTDEQTGQVVRKAEVPVDFLMYDEILGLEIMSEMTLNSASKYWKEYESVRFGQVIEKLTGYLFRDTERIKEEILEFCKLHGRRPRVRKG